MARTPEGKVKDSVVRMLKTFGVYYFMPVQTGYGKTTLDFLCCHHGRFFAIETKASGKKMTARQEIVAEEIKAAGGHVFVIDGFERAAMLPLELYLMKLAVGAP